MAFEKAQLGPLGWFYLAFVICWNVSLVAAMAFLWRYVVKLLTTFERSLTAYSLQAS